MQDHIDSEIDRNKRGAADHQMCSTQKEQNLGMWESYLEILEIPSTKLSLKQSRLSSLSLGNPKNKRQLLPKLAGASTPRGDTLQCHTPICQSHTPRRPSSYSGTEENWLTGLQNTDDLFKNLSIAEGEISMLLDVEETVHHLSMMEL